MFTTSVDGQTLVDLHVVQGERELVKDCRSLGRFELRIDPMPAGMPKIEVTFLIDANGILQVQAREQRSGKAASIEVKPTYGLSETDVERMIEDSFTYAEADVERLTELLRLKDLLGVSLEELKALGVPRPPAVAFNGLGASFAVTSDTAIQATVPASATTGPLSVTTPLTVSTLMLLPSSASWCEGEGTVTNSERRVQRVRDLRADRYLDGPIRAFAGQGSPREVLRSLLDAVVDRRMN